MERTGVATRRWEVGKAARGKQEARVVASWVIGLPNDVGVWPGAKTDGEVWPREKGRIPGDHGLPKGP
jgi:hypothetical protein